MTDYYFTDRKYNLLGIAATLGGSVYFSKVNDKQSIETSSRSFEGIICFEGTTEAMTNARLMTEVGNFVLYKDLQGQSVWITIEEQRFDPSDNSIEISGTDAGIDLINELVGPYTPDKQYTIAEYIERFTYDSGFEIGVNEISNLKRKLSGWDSTTTTLERIISVATQFDNAEIDFSFDVQGLSVVKKYINIYKKRGGSHNVTLYVGQQIDHIVTNTDIYSLATAIYPEGGTEEGKDTPVTLKGYKWTDPEGRYLITSGGQLWDTVAVQRWSRLLSNVNAAPDRAHIVTRKTYETTNQKTLLDNALRNLKEINEPTVNYEATIADFPSQVHVGDTINLVDEWTELYLSARVLELSYDYADERAEALLGDYLIQEGRIEIDLQNLAQQLKERVEKMQEEVKAKTKYIRSDVQPSETENVIWVDTSKTPNIVKTWDGTSWVKATPETAAEVGAYEESKGTHLEEVTEDHEERIVDVTTSVHDVNQAIEDMANDNILSIVEKKSVSVEIETIKVKYENLAEFATNNQIDFVDYKTAYDALIAYTTPILARIDANSVIVRDTYKKKFTDYYAAETAFLNSISQEIKDLLNSTIVDNTDALAELNKELAEKIKNVQDELNEIIPSVEDRVGEVETSISNANKRIDDSLAEFKKLSDASEGLTIKVNDLEGTIDSISKQTTQNTTDITAVKQSATDLSTTVGKVQTDLGTTKTDVTNLKQTAAEVSKSIISLEESDSATNKKLNEVKSTADGNKETIASIQTEQGKTNNKLNEVVDTVDSHTQSISSVTNDLKTNYVTNTKFEQNNNTIEGQITTAKNDAISGSKSYTDTQIKATEDEISAGVSSAKTYTDQKSSAAQSAAEKTAKGYVDKAKADARLYTAYCNDLQGYVDFTREWPRENLLKEELISSYGSNVTITQENGVYTIVAPSGSNEWGYGMKFLSPSDNLITVPWNNKAIISMEVYVPKALNWNVDINTYWVSGTNPSTTNDNDSSTNRYSSYKSILAKTWTKIWWSWENTNTANTGKVSLYDNSNWGIVTTNETASVTYQIRNIKYEVTDELISSPSVYTSVTSSDPLNSFMKYTGYSAIDSDDPSVYTWAESPAQMTELKQAQIDITPDAIYNKVSSVKEYTEWKDGVDSKPNQEDLDSVKDNVDGMNEDLYGGDTVEKGIITRMSEMEQTTYSWGVSLNEQRETINEQGKTVDLINNYITFKPDATGNGAYLQIGGNQDNFSMQLSREELGFYDGLDRVAYINNKQFNFTQGVITDSLQIGGHQLVKLNDSHTIFQWGG